MMILQTFLRRLLAVFVVLFLIGRYGNREGVKSLLEYVVPYPPLQPIVAVFLIILVIWLVSYKTKNRTDYSRFFYNLLVRLFGDPAKKKRN